MKFHQAFHPVIIGMGTPFAELLGDLIFSRIEIISAQSKGVQHPEIAAGVQPRGICHTVFHHREGDVSGQVQVAVKHLSCR
jgi:hypothetical protein